MEDDKGKSKKIIENIVSVTVFVATGYVSIKNIKKVKKTILKKVPFM